MILFLYGCHRAPLVCRSEYIYPDYLASEQILTPDPCRRCFFGQQVIVFWSLPRRFRPDELKLYVRYGTREQATISWPLSMSYGYRIYRLVNDAYWCLEGIVSFKAELYREGECIADWTQHLWTEIINVGGNEE